VSLIDKSGANTCLEYADLAVPEQIFRFFDSALKDILIRSPSGGFLEELGEMMNAHVGGLGEFVQSNIFIHMVFDKDSIQPDLGQSRKVR
jgi:hypothetical protein